MSPAHKVLTSQRPADLRELAAAIGRATVVGASAGAASLALYAVFISPPRFDDASVVGVLSAFWRALLSPMFGFFFFFPSGLLISFLASLIFGTVVWAVSRARPWSPALYAVVGAGVGYGIFAAFAQPRLHDLLLALFGAIAGFAGGWAFGHGLERRQVSREVTPWDGPRAKLGAWARRAWDQLALMMGFAFVAFLILLVVTILTVFLERAVEKQRGYQLVTLKSRMYWKDGEAVPGDRVKTWRLAVPLDFRLYGKHYDSQRTLVFWNPVFSTRGVDQGALRTVQVDATLTAAGELVSPDAEGRRVTLQLSNAPSDPSIRKTYVRPADASDHCVSSGNWVDYRGWVVSWSPPKDWPPERICTFFAGALDRWTIELDDLLSAESGR